MTGKGQIIGCEAEDLLSDGDLLGSYSVVHWAGGDVFSEVVDGASGVVTTFTHILVCSREGILNLF